MILGDLVDAGVAEIRTGPFGTQLHASDYVSAGRPVLNVRNVGFGEVRPEKLEYVDEATAERLSGHVLRQGDIVFGRKGAVERHAYIKGPFVGALQGSDCIRLRLADESPIRAAFVTFALRTREHQEWMQGFCSHGATMASLNQAILRQVRLPDLDLATQDQVVEILSSIDELIENNRRRIELLQQMAQAIYREWFVHFHYPGYEDTTFADSPLGPIPEGWQVKPLRDLIDVDKGLSYKGAHLTETGTPMANLKCFWPGGGFRRAGTKPYSGPFKPKHEIVPGDLIVANTDLTQAGAVIGSPAVVPRRGFETGGIISHHLFAIRCAEPAMLPWLYQVFAEHRFRDYARGVASGTTVLGFRPADLLSYQVVCPPRDQYKSFNELARNIFQLAEDLNDGAEQLATIRDLLLPKLVTGQIDVSKLELDALVESVT